MDRVTYPASYVEKLKTAMHTLRAVPTHHSPHQSSYVSEALVSSSHVFVRHDAVKTPLQQPYDGPYKVIQRAPKYFTLDIKGRHDTVSIDRLKPAHLDCQHNPVTYVPTLIPTPPTTPPSPPPKPSTSREPVAQSTRLGRRVHWPKHLTNFVP